MIEKRKYENISIYKLNVCDASYFWLLAKL